MPLGCGMLAMLGGASAPSPYPPQTLLLLVASWCAPCRVELSRLDAIAEAAGPWQVRVVPVDATRATSAMLRTVDPGRVWRSARGIEALSRDTGGLPFSMMTDAAGQPCARHSRMLDAAAVREMRGRCEAAR